MKIILSFTVAATKQRLELELAEAAQEDQVSTGSGDTGSRGEGEEVGSGSDSEGEGEGREMQPSGNQMQNSLEMSLWSLDVSMPSGMESSIFETEVYTELGICTYIVTVLPPHIHVRIYMYTRVHFRPIIHAFYISVHCIYSTYRYIQCESTLP